MLSLFFVAIVLLDEEKLDEAKASLQSILENAEGLTAEELQESISKIFENKGEK